MRAHFWGCCEAGRELMRTPSGVRRAGKWIRACLPSLLGAAGAGVAGTAGSAGSDATAAACCGAAVGGGPAAASPARPKATDGMAYQFLHWNEKAM